MQSGVLWPKTVTPRKDKLAHTVTSHGHLHTIVNFFYSAAYHFDTQWASSVATATTRSLSGGLNNSSFHFSQSQ